MKLLKRYSALGAFILLTLSNVYTINRIENQSDERIKDQANLAAQVQRASCERGNDLRLNIRRALDGQIALVMRDPESTVADVNGIKSLQAEFGAVDCNKVVRQNSTED